MSSPLPKNSGRNSITANDSDLVIQVRNKYAKVLRPSGKGRLPNIETTITAIQELLEGIRAALHRWKHSIAVNDQTLSARSTLKKRAINSIKSTNIDGHNLSKRSSTLRLS